MDADIGVRVSTHLTDTRTGTRCRWYTRLAAECTCPPAQARCPPLGTADDHVAADWLDGDGASTFAESARLRRYSRSNRGRCARRAWPVLTSGENFLHSVKAPGWRRARKRPGSLGGLRRRRPGLKPGLLRLRRNAKRPRDHGIEEVLRLARRRHQRRNPADAAKSAMAVTPTQYLFERQANGDQRDQHHGYPDEPVSWLHP